MMLQIPNVLDLDQVAECRKHLDAAEWVDGRVTAGHQSAQVKKNQQIPEDHPVARQIGDAIVSILNRHPLFISAALPKRIRTDLSATLFLCAPEDYDGGELIVEDTYGSHSAKLGAGDMVLYPSTSLHHVRPVTRGVRVCSFFWMQSLIRDDGQRTMLFDLDQSIQRLGRDHPDHSSIMELTAIYHNLLRQWAEL